MEVRELHLSEWGEALPSSGYEIFHRPEALSVIEDHAPGTDMRLYGGFKGEQVRALLPLFVRRLPLGGRIVSSPPPGLNVPHLGPAVMPVSPKQRKRERLNEQFIEDVIDRLELDSRTLFFMVCSPEYEDPRPFTWADQSVDVSFTYNLRIGDQSPEEVLRAFSKSRRREIRNGEDMDLVIERGDESGARRIYEQTVDHFAAQDEHLGLTWPFVRDLYRTLGDRMRVYCARSPDGEFLSGIIALYSDDAASFWLGGVRTEYGGISANTLVHWAIIRDVAEDPVLDSVTRYDMVGAGERRLSRYKSKFNPNLDRYYVVDSGGVRMRLAEAAYGAVESVGARVPDVPDVSNAATSAAEAVRSRAVCIPERLR